MRVQKWGSRRFVLGLILATSTVLLWMLMRPVHFKNNPAVLLASVHSISNAHSVELTLSNRTAHLLVFRMNGKVPEFRTFFKKGREWKEAEMSSSVAHGISSLSQNGILRTDIEIPEEADELRFSLLVIPLSYRTKLANTLRTTLDYGWTRSLYYYLYDFDEKKGLEIWSPAVQPKK